MPEMTKTRKKCRAAVIWIDWYAYHIARFEGLQEAFGRNGEVYGIELVGGVGVHVGLKFRDERSPTLPVETLLPNNSWAEANKLNLSRLIWKRLSDLNPEVVLVPGYYTLPAIMAALWARLHRRESVLMTESTAYDHGRTSWKEALKSLVLRVLFTSAVAGGKAHIQYLEQLAFRKPVASFYDVVGNDQIKDGVAALRRTSNSKTHRLPDDYFLYVGRLSPEKNVEGLIRAWLNYREHGGSWMLVIAGDGPEAPNLKASVSRSPYASEVLFVGHKSSYELLPYFSFAKSFVLASTREPWGLVVNEAMAASLPVIVSSRCGCAEDLVIEGANGFVFDPSKKDQLVTCLQKLEKTSPRERAAMGEASAAIIERYSPLNFGRQILSISNKTCFPELKEPLSTPEAI